MILVKYFITLLTLFDQYSNLGVIFIIVTELYYNGLLSKLISNATFEEQHQSGMHLHHSFRKNLLMLDSFIYPFSYKRYPLERLLIRLGGIKISNLHSWPRCLGGDKHIVSGHATARAVARGAIT